MRFLIDAQLPPRLADWLREKGHDALHVREAPGLGAADREIVASARAGNMAIVTKDADFLDLIDSSPPQLLWVRTGNAATTALLARFEAQ
ncbi:DUF5615 family PIN-like protein [Amphiplicatus metriothermophilus]|uniref:Predicted nuclease, contains PIN domain, potential toxin-antitoxin system component n=1 Tax=Amphiplicatus metriothermophilus TaxID=1519374 RepID=A0A239PZH5_9PROT|nr:DUF5615 family PIN-like protein [Amphiplicatus metriothermophilus]MBB5518197.1 putative nuclease of putative toxin-antitoxin system [Amphiplicatus metriothermophilus]SNT75366.1 Predicted nuclease, contains PIN domain, potential toxin-antitoxin system component [Amphiplicatus metriothermophilus]